MPSKERIIVGLSGGVDSAVAAWMLKQQGHDVVGVFMKNWEDDDTDEYCTSRQDLIDAVSVAEVIGIDIEAVNFSREYKERVFAHFLREYQSGRTPNPDVLCNSEIKFRAFVEHALQLGADRIATGHYAGVRKIAGRYQLLKAADASKDQSYFLHRLTQEQLAAVEFPLANITKREVRSIAQQQGLPNYAKKDSTGICFIGERPFREFLSRYLARHPGPMETPEGRIVNEHHGLMYYTLGQRQGLGIGGIGGNGSSAPWFVAAKDVSRNALIVVQGHDHPLLTRERIDADNLHWIAGEAPPANAPLAGKTRYRQPDAPCQIRSLDHDRCEVDFADPQWAPTPGQYVVFYDQRVCLGGGVIQ